MDFQRPTLGPYGTVLAWSYFPNQEKIAIWL
jgi:hypothetical protein